MIENVDKMLWKHAQIPLWRDRKIGTVVLDANCSKTNLICKDVSVESFGECG